MPQYDTIAIVGVGLIGASIGLALRERRLARRVIGIGRTAPSLETARLRGAIDDMSTCLETGVRDAQITIVCTPVEQIAAQVLLVAANAPPGAIVSDAGSTKAEIVSEVEASQQAPIRFIGSHPLAGSEKAGPEHARADLFVGRVVVVTPTNTTPPDVLAQISLFWQELGARVVEMSPDAHDAAVAATSHAPHAIASALAAATLPEHLPLVAGGWLDTTRIAAGDPELWRQILLSNADHSLRALAKFETVLSQLRHALAKGDGDSLRRILEAGKQTRDAVGN